MTLCNFKNVVLLMAIFLLAACASPPPKSAPVVHQSRSGEEMLRESQGMAQLGEQWLSGKKKVEQGEVLVREGEAKIQQGQREIDEGRRIMKESEAGYTGLKH